MFMHRGARCEGCSKVFCCSKHRREHQLSCSEYKKLPPGPIKKVRMNQNLKSPKPYSPSISIRNDVRVNAGSKKRKHNQSGSPFPRGLGNSPSRIANLFLIPSERRVKRAVRGKFKKILRIPTLEPVKEEDEGEDEVPNVPSLAFMQKPPVDSANTHSRVVDHYNDFIAGSLKESPIIVATAQTLEKSEAAVISPNATSGVINSNEIDKYSTPNVEPTPTCTARLGETPLSKVAFAANTPRIGLSLAASTPKDSEQKSEIGDATSSSDQSPLAALIESPLEVAADVTASNSLPPNQVVPNTPIDSRIRTQRKFLRSASSSGSSCSSAYYSACSIISPLALNSHPRTPVSNPSLFTTVKDVFRTFIHSRLPGVPGEEPMNSGVSPVVDSPARKRMKSYAESRVKCRPTYQKKRKQTLFLFNA